MALAAARDSGDARGKSPGLRGESVAVGLMPELFGFSALAFTCFTRTFSRCCAYYIRKPFRQRAIAGVSLKLILGHAVEQLVHVGALYMVNPLTRVVDLGICLNGCNHCRRIHFHRFCLLDNTLQRLSDIPLALAEEVQ